MPLPKSFNTTIIRLIRKLINEPMQLVFTVWEERLANVNFSQNPAFQCFWTSMGHKVWYCVVRLQGRGEPEINLSEEYRICHIQGACLTYSYGVCLNCK